MVFLTRETECHVIASRPGQLTNQGLFLLRKSIPINLVRFCSNTRPTKRYGYFVAIKKMNSIGQGRLIDESTEEVVFPVNFTQLTQKPEKGEILTGTIKMVLEGGVFIKSVPVDNIFLSGKDIQDYKYVPGENPVFLRGQESSRFEKGGLVRFKIMAVRWKEQIRDFQCLATIDGDNLGPI